MCPGFIKFDFYCVPIFLCNFLLRPPLTSRSKVAYNLIVAQLGKKYNVVLWVMCSRTVVELKKLRIKIYRSLILKRNSESIIIIWDK
jgi:hypothetical protein